jgi:Spy/CpxP family protein refolding chaperone
MMQELDLTQEQLEQMKVIRENGGSREEMHAVLTPEQQARAAELRKASGERRAKRVDKLKVELGLSDEQAQQMRDIFEAGGSRDDIRAVMTQEQQAQFDQMRKSHKGGGGKLR